MDWLWQGRIPVGALTLLVGKPGTGKTTLALDLAAKLSRAETPSSVIFSSVEDSLAHTLVPRLHAASADLDRVTFITVGEHEGVESALTLPDDIEKLESAIRAVDARLVVVDPITAHLAIKYDSHRDQHVRRLLAPLAQLADRTDVAVVGIGHLNKNQSTDRFNRIGGSIGFAAAARSILLLAPDPDAADDSPYRLLAHLKSNLATPAPALRLEIQSSTIAVDGFTILTSVIAWRGEATGVTVESLLGERSDDDEATTREVAREIILAALAEGDHPWLHLVGLVAEATGGSERTARRARDVLSREALVETFKAGRGWRWRLTEDAATPTRGQLDTGHMAATSRGQHDSLAAVEDPSNLATLNVAGRGDSKLATSVGQVGPEDREARFRGDEHGGDEEAIQLLRDELGAVVVASRRRIE